MKSLEQKKLDIILNQVNFKVTNEQDNQKRFRGKIWHGMDCRELNSVMGDISKSEAKEKAYGEMFHFINNCDGTEYG